MGVFIIFPWGEGARNFGPGLGGVITKYAHATGAGFMTGLSQLVQATHAFITYYLLVKTCSLVGAVLHETGFRPAQMRTRVFWQSFDYECGEVFFGAFTQTLANNNIIVKSKRSIF